MLAITRTNERIAEIPIKKPLTDQDCVDLILNINTKIVTGNCNDISVDDLKKYLKLQWLLIDLIKGGLLNP